MSNDVRVESRSDAVAAAAAAAAPLAVSLRRDLHRHPELGWTEFFATSRVVAALRDLGVERIVFGGDLYRDARRMGVPDTSTLEAAAGRAAALGVDERELDA